MILVTGATGNVGLKVLASLKATDDQVRAFVRSPEKGEALAAPYAVGDFADPSTFPPALEGVSTVFLLPAPGPQQVEQEGAFIDACVAAGVQHVVKLSAVGADHDPVPDVSFLHWHAESERRLMDSGLGYSILRAHGFMSNLLDHAGTVRAQRTIYAAMGDGRIPWVDTRDLADLAAGILRDPEDHRDQSYLLTGPEAVGMGDVAAKLSDLLGDRVTYVDVPSETARSGMLEAGLPDWRADALVTLDGWYRDEDVSLVSPVLPILLAKPARTLDDFLAEHREAFS